MANDSSLATQPQAVENNVPSRKPKRWSGPPKWIVLPLFLLAGVLWWRSRPATLEVTAPAERVVVESLAATGQVRGDVESNIGATTGGRVLRLWVKENQRATAGQLLAQMDDRVLRAQVQQATDGVATAQAVVAQASRPALPSEIAALRAETAQAVEVGRARLAAAQQKVMELRRGPTREQREQAQGQLRQAQARLRQAEIDVGRQRKLFAGGRAQRGELERAITAVRVGEEALGQATAQLAQARLEVGRQQQLYRTSAAAELDLARTALRVAQENLDRTNAELTLAKKEFERQRMLFEGGAAPRAELDRAQAAQQVAVNAVEQAKAQVEQARIDLQRQQQLFDEGTVPRSELERAEAQVRIAARGADQAREQLEGARVELARQRQLFNTNERADLDRSESALRVARGEVATAAARVRELQVGTRPEAIAQAESEVEAARAALSGAQEGGAAKLATLLAQPRPEDIAVARARLVEARQNLEVARRRLDEATIKAPFGGVVASIETEVGGAAAPGQPILRLVRIGVPEIRVDVDESNLGRLRTGQKAIITNDAFAGVTFQARLREIGAQIDPERGTVELKLDPIAPPRWLRSGQTVSINIIINPGTRHLTVPLTAVVTTGNRAQVMLVRGGTVRSQQVTVGAAGPDGIPVLSGLKRDDQVITSPSSVTPGQKVRGINALRSTPDDMQKQAN